MGFVDKVLSEANDNYYKVNATDSTGRRAFYYIKVDRHKLRSFLAIRPDGHYDLRDFGEIIYSAYGEEPTIDAKRMLNREHGFRFEIEEDDLAEGTGSL